MNLPFASLPVRAAAYVIDIGAAGAGVLLLQAVLYPVNPLLRAAGSANVVALHAWVTLTVTLPIAAFLALSWASAAGATPGMRLLHLRVRTAAGKRVPFGRAAIRSLILLVPFEVNHAVLFHPEPIWGVEAPGFRIGFLVVYTLVLFYLVVAWRLPTQQGPHDLVAGTVVVRRGERA